MHHLFNDNDLQLQCAIKESFLYQVDRKKGITLIHYGGIRDEGKAGVREEQRGRAKYLGPGLVRGALNLGKTSGHVCFCQGSWGPVNRNHLLALGPGPGSRQP